MNATDKISFLCPSCSTHLTIPTQLAGVTGPCPHCQVLIQAPYPAQPPAPVQESASHPLAPSPQQTYYQQPEYPPQYQAPPQEAPTYHTQPQEIPPGHRPNVPAAPRHLPDRSASANANIRQRMDPSGDLRSRAEVAGPPPHRPHRSRFLRLVIPVVFLCLALGVVYGVKTFLQMDRSGKTDSTKSLAGDDHTDKKVLPILAEDAPSSFEDLTAGDTETLPVGDTAMPEIGTAPPAKAVDSGIAALRLLESFLAMKSLEERLPHIESKLKEEELMSSVLNGPLPEVVKIEVDVRETNSIEQLVDHYYFVDFAAEGGGVNQQTMLVRMRGDADPKVVVDPFLDLFGGRFEKYAATPSKDSATFQLIISASSKCYDDVPTPDKKLPLKIMTREQTKEIGKAFCGKQSRIGLMLTDETSGLSYGQPTACTVFMRWNTEEDPDRPFLEALDIISLDWNP